jgi:ubiquinone/menaquinone biosynthesis C-methylase UbiE/DNA-binding XRE family transcriptional regulator
MYDETRRALDEHTLNGIKYMLTKHHCHSILEIGVGTARVALPLANSGFEVTGLDISKRMIEKAQTKGITNLILAEGSRAPFKDRSFDATLMAHVFHLLPDPLSVMQEAAKISRVGVFALVRKRTEDRGSRRWPFLFFGPRNEFPNSDARTDNMDEGTKRMYEERRERLRQIAKKYGYKWDRALQGWRNWAHEYEILGKYPPDDVKIVSDVILKQSLEDRLSRLEKGAFSSMSSMPDGMRRELARELRSFAKSHPESGFSRPRREVYQVAMWSSQKLLSRWQKEQSGKYRKIVDFDIAALFEALDAKRKSLRLSWARVAKEMWEMSAELNRRRPNDHPISPATIISMSRQGNTTCQHALIFLQWLGRSPESFLPSLDSGHRSRTALPSVGTNKRLRWNLHRLYEAINARRQELQMTWVQLAQVIGCAPNQLTGIRTARYAINMKLAMRIVQWLERPASDFIYPAEW